MEDIKQLIIRYEQYKVNEGIYSMIQRCRVVEYWLSPKHSTYFYIINIVRILCLLHIYNISIALIYDYCV